MSIGIEALRHAVRLVCRTLDWEPQMSKARSVSGQYVCTGQAVVNQACWPWLLSDRSGPAMKWVPDIAGSF